MEQKVGFRSMCLKTENWFGKVNRIPKKKGANDSSLGHYTLH